MSSVVGGQCVQALLCLNVTTTLVLFWHDEMEGFCAMDGLQRQHNRAVNNDTTLWRE
jgi:hypothetical protein